MVARDPAGRLHVRKLLSENPEQYPDAALQAIREFLGVSDRDGAIPTARIRAVRMGTTVATNALLERQGADVCLVVTRGFADLLRIGYQERPDIFALEIRKAEEIFAAVVEVDERILADGTIRRRPDLARLRQDLAPVRSRGIQAVAVVLLHSYAYPEHELQVAELCREAGFADIHLSHEVSGEIKAVARGDTTTVDAYLTPSLRRYVARVRAALGAAVELKFMQSHGGLVDADNFRGKDAILSGPAGGVVAVAHLAELTGCEKVIGFDMGGTSTDVSRFDGSFERVFETLIAGVRIQAPMLNLVTVAAGGGSILKFEDGRFRVGPESAGANPGPACYRRGGPLTVTDANAVLGRIQPDYFPRCFGPQADQPLAVERSRAVFGELAQRIGAASGREMSVVEVAAGFVRIANENMIKPIRQISVARGYDVREYTLLCFGGAGAQHACAIAAALGIGRVLLHPLAGVLSAYGLGFADVIRTDVEAVIDTLEENTLARLSPRFEAIERRARAQVLRQGIAADRISQWRSLDLRYAGVESSLNVPLAEGSSPRRDFEDLQRQLFGCSQPGHPVEIVNLRVETRGENAKPHEAKKEAVPHPLSDAHAFAAAEVHFDVLEADGRRHLRRLRTPIFRRDELKPGARLEGPALVIEAVSTVVVDPGWRARVNEYGHLLLEAVAPGKRRELVSTRRDPVLLELFNNLFMSVAEQMGIVLRQVSHSTNIKERLDFSCAIFDARGRLIANAPHIPVHLGAMGESVQALLAARKGALRPGDVYATNDPYHGGSHLPDITVVTPVFAAGGAPMFFVASRAHHADIGGVTPGSMPPFSRTLDEEGVLIHDLLLVRAGWFREKEVIAVLTGGRYPARDIPERLSDLRAAVAANAGGVRLLEELVERYGAAVVQAYMGHVKDNAAEAMRAVIAALPDGDHEFSDFMDDGQRLMVTVRIAGNSAQVDFTGTAPQHCGNLNAPRAVVTAAVLYVFRTLISRTIPLNAGCLEPLTITVPAGSLLDPRPPAAVAGGNVETSMRITDVLFGALRKLAGSQGTMNNVSFGTDKFAYYETICGGAGAGLGFDGADAVHTHMTNTRITDPEIIETRYPVVIRAFAIRRGSGGAGVWRGGDGVRREIEFLQTMNAAILSERRTVAPYGLNGAKPGMRGRNTLVRAGRITELPGKVSLEVSPGDVLVIETPGGGGCNPPAVG